jgi:hypothetical protein
MVEHPCRVCVGGDDLGDLFWGAGRGRFAVGFPQLEYTECKGARGENRGIFGKCAAFRGGFYIYEEVKLL